MASFHMQLASLSFVILFFTFHHCTSHSDVHFDSDHLHDKEHLKEHLDLVADKPVEKMSREEMEFHYFKMHDTDNNNLLDGLELAKSFMDHHGKGVAEVMTDTEIQTVVSSVMKNQDVNDDGYIDYMEFVATAKRM